MNASSYSKEQVARNWAITPSNLVMPVMIHNHDTAFETQTKLKTGEVLPLFGNLKPKVTSKHHALSLILSPYFVPILKT